MTQILEYRDIIKKFYRMNAVVILPILKFLLAFISLNGVNVMMGYMPRLDTLTIVLLASLACSFLPAGCLILLCTLFSLAHMYALSLEVLAIGLAFYLLIFLVLLRFAPSDSYVVILTPLFFALRIPYVIPIAVGLVGSPLSAISVGCGVIVYYFLKIVVGCAPAISVMDDKQITDKVTYLINNLLQNKTMLIIAASFALTVIVVWILHRLAIDHAWTIAMVAGAMVNLVFLLIGDLKYDIRLSLGSAIFGSIIAVLVGKVIEFFRFCVDYGRTERVQFEDDEYYYYVKAIPKMNVSAPTKTVKKINTNTQSIPPIGDAMARKREGSRTVAQTRTGSQGRRPGAAEKSKPVARDGQGRNASQGRKPAQNGQGRVNPQGRTVNRDEQRRVTSREALQNEIPMGETQAYEPVEYLDDEMGDTKTISLSWNGGQESENVSMTGGSATFGDVPQAEEQQQWIQDDAGETGDYEELF